MPLSIPEHPAISADLEDLLHKIMEKDTEKRIGIKDIMEHRWFQTDPINVAIFTNKELGNQRARSRLQVRSISPHHTCL